MARPTTKSDLLQTSEEQFDKLQTLLGTLSEKELAGTFNFDLGKEKGAHWVRDKNIRDILIHLLEWHKLLLNWVETNQRGEEQSFLRSGYNWRSYGEMNVVFWQEHQSTSYEEALESLLKTHRQVMELAKTFTNEELFSKNIFPWVGGSTLGSYFVSASASHYDWAVKKIRKYKKMQA